MPADAPPTYSASQESSSAIPRLAELPSHITFKILENLALQDLVLTLRPVSRTLYLHAMTYARLQGLSLWLEEVYGAASTRGAVPSTDPLGDAPAPSAPQPSADADLPAYDHSAGGPASPLAARSRELAVFDLFLVALSHSLARLGASSLLFTSEDDALRLLPREKRTDLWGLLQPRARCEDLLAAQLGGTEPIHGEDVRVELKAREARVLLPFRGAGGRETWKGVASISRDPPEPLETLAERLAGELQRARVHRKTEGEARWYEALK